MAIYSVSHPQCGASRTIRCNCTPPPSTPPAEIPSAHRGDCAASDFDAALNCIPDKGCCGQDHHHGQQADETGKPCRPINITVLDLGVVLQAG